MENAIWTNNLVLLISNDLTKSPEFITVHTFIRLVKHCQNDFCMNYERKHCRNGLWINYERKHCRNCLCMNYERKNLCIWKLLIHLLRLLWNIILNITSLVKRWYLSFAVFQNGVYLLPCFWNISRDKFLNFGGIISSLFWGISSMQTLVKIVIHKRKWTQFCHSQFVFGNSRIKLYLL